MLDKSELRAVNVSNCLKIYNSLPTNEDFKEKFFVKLGGVEELVYQNSRMEDSDLLIGGRPIKKELFELKDSIKSLDSKSKQYFCAGLSELFLKNASLISKDELKILEELDPNFDQNNPNFKKQFLQKVGEEFNVLRKNKEFWEGNVEALTQDKPELQGYFCEGLSNALTQLEPQTAIGLQNSYQLFQLLSGKPVENLGIVGQFLLKFTQNQQSFAEDLKTKIDKNLKSFPQKFAQSFVDFLTNVKDEDGKQKANALIEDIRTNGSLQLIREITILLDRNLSRDGVTGTASGIQVGSLRQTYSDIEGCKMQNSASANQDATILADGSRLSSLRGVSEDDRQQQSFLSKCANLFRCIRSDLERENGAGPVASQSLASNRGNQTQQPALENSMAGTDSPSAEISSASPKKIVSFEDQKNLISNNQFAKISEFSRDF